MTAGDGMVTPQGENVPVRVTHVSGLASCTICSAVISWKLPWAELDNVRELRCPGCQGVLDVARHSAVMLVERGDSAQVVG